MQITFSPVRLDETLALSVAGDVLTANGSTLDLGAVKDGDTLPAAAVDSPWINGPVTRSGGVLSVTIRLPHGIDDDAPARWPDPMTVEADGSVSLPSWGEDAPDPVLNDGVIAVDWSQLVTAEAAAQEVLAQKRATASLTLGQFAVNAARFGYITFDEADAWATSAILPAQILSALDQIADQGDKLEAKAAFARPVEPIRRNAERLPFVALAFGVPKDQIDTALDALFGISS